MSTNTKFAAFTLFEILITMILSVVVVSMMYLLYNVVRKEWLIISKQQNNITMLVQFRKTMHNDISKAQHMFTGHFRELYIITEQLYSSKNDTIKYFFDSLIVRSVNNNMDTFNICISNLQYSHVQSFHNAPIVKRIKFDILSPISINHVSFQKRYTSSELMSLSF